MNEAHDLPVGDHWRLGCFLQRPSLLEPSHNYKRISNDRRSFRTIARHRSRAHKSRRRVESNVTSNRSHEGSTTRDDSSNAELRNDARSGL